ncbi:MAG: TonB-dependent receptor [Acidobacteriota bacterium]|nr:TonB-dependent receptor [Acidobacteriota bacterium]
MRRLAGGFFLLALLGAPAFGDAPETGTITGTVSDAGGTPLPGVNVTTSGERGEKFSVTQADGTFRFALLVPGNYTVTALLEGMGESEAAVVVEAGGREQIDLKLALATEETINITAESPMVDKYNVTAGTTVSAEVGAQTAGTTRSYYGVINALPGVTSDADNDDIQQTRPQVNGSHFADQAVFVDGVDTTFAKFGGSRVFLPTTALTEVSMEAGGSSAEYGRAVGSWTNVIVKSGTNKFHASGMVQEQDVEWGADYQDHIELEQRETFPFPRDYFKRNDFEKDNHSTGYEASVGGPIKTDKAWFFVAFSDFDDVNWEKGLVTQNLLPGQDIGGDPINSSFQMEAQIFKFNYQPKPEHSLVFSFMDTPAQRTYRHPPMADYWTPTPHILSGELGSASYNLSISADLFLEFKVAVHDSAEDKTLACGSTSIKAGAFDHGRGEPAAGEFDCLAAKAQDRGPDGTGPLRFPADPSQGIHWPGNNYGVYIDTAFMGAWHNGWILSDGFGTNEFPRDQANVGLTQFAGAQHEIKYGLDFQETAWEGNNFRSALYFGPNYTSFNPFGYIGAGSGDPGTCGLLSGSFCGWYDYNADFLVNNKGSGDSQVTDTAFFVRDRFTVGDHWTFNLGARAEKQTGTNDIGREVFDASYISPRLSVTYDIKGDGKMLASLNAGQYHAQLNQAWIAGGGTSAGGLHDQWNGFTGLETWLFCDPTDVAALGGFGLCTNSAGVPEVGYNYAWSREDVGHYWQLHDAGVFQSDIDPYYKEELVAGFEWQFSRNWAMDTKLILWDLKNMMMSNTQLGLGGQQFYLTANYKDVPDILRSIEDARLANGIAPQLSQAALDNFPEGKKEYKALQVQFNRRLANGWALYNNISWSETETTGSGAWWNNTNSNYAEDFQVVLDQGMIDTCTAQQANRTLPIDCQTTFGQFIGQPVSTINRFGKDINNDRPIIFNSFGYKTWQAGKQDFTLGGHFTYQSGLPWVRFESVSNTGSILSGGNRGNSTVELRTAPAGDHGTRHVDEYTINLSGAWGFPLGKEGLRGEFRVEVLNVTDQQRLRNLNFGRQSGQDSSSIAGRGTPWPARRVWQRPRQVRANVTVRF